MDVAPVEAACARFGLRGSPVEVSARANLVVRVGDWFVRLTREGEYRSAADNEAECAYVLHLDSRGVAVCPPRASVNGLRMERIGDWLVSVFPRAPGVQLPPERWDARVATEWGRALGRIHAASVGFRPSPDRWVWHDELWLARAAELVPDSDPTSLAIFRSVSDHLRALPRDEATFGMGHGDFAPSNFGWDTERGVTAFDFGNCCHHFFARDLVVGLNTTARHPARDALWSALRAGYVEEFPLPTWFDDELPWLGHLRQLTIYLSRLWSFGPRPDPEQAAVLDRLRADVHAGWPPP